MNEREYRRRLNAPVGKVAAPAEPMQVSAEQVTEASPHHFTVEASSLGLKPGQWPTTFNTKWGNGQPFKLLCSRQLNGEVMSVVYMQSAGCVFLEIFND